MRGGASRVCEDEVAELGDEPRQVPHPEAKHLHKVAEAQHFGGDDAGVDGIREHARRSTLPLRDLIRKGEGGQLGHAVARIRPDLLAVDGIDV